MQATTFTDADWQQYAHNYDALCALRPYTELIEYISDTLAPTPQDTILDAGCGTGNLLAQLSRATKCHRRLVGIDASSAMLACAQRKVSGTSRELVAARLDAPLPFPDATFTKIACVHVLYAVPDPCTTLRELVRILTPGGTLVLVTPKHGYENGLVLRAHCKSTEPEVLWCNAHASPERERFLIRKAFTDADLIERMIRVAEHNRHIARDRTFHFFTAPALTALCAACGLVTRESSYVYADQSLFVHAIKEEAP